MTMKWTIVLVCILSIAFGLKTVSKSHRQNVSAPSSASTFVYNQLVDHYDPLNTNTYSQRYSVDVPSSWSNGDPIFIFLAGEAPMEFFEFQEVQSRLWGKQFGAIYISLEHRFYGDSIPNNNTGNGPYSTENLRYLTSQQALADAAYFIENFEVETLPFLIRKGVISPQSIENKTEKQSKWIVFGCSYSGALSAWFRAKYSNLVVASVAPSGPVFAQTNYSGYYQLFQKVASPDCVAAVQAAVQIISEKLQTEDGRSYLASTFNSCAAIPAAEHEQYYFLYSLTGVLGSSDQYENPEQWPLNQTCAIMTKSTDYVGNWAEVFATQNSPTLKRNVNAQCNDFNEVTGFIEPMRDTTSQDRSWVWQTCVEFGFFTPTVGSIFWPERIDLERQIKWCEQIYGIQGMTPNTNWTNAYYGGYDLHGTSIMFSNGLFDPWHLLSINEDLPWGVSAVTYEAGHCAPMIASYPDDPVSLVQARVKIGKFLAQALSS